MRGIQEWVVLSALGLVVCACAAHQKNAGDPLAAEPTETASEPFSTSGEMDVGVSFDDGADATEEEEEDVSHEPPPTPTYSPANKLSPEEKGAAR
jgi:hypothetical protein